MYIIFYNPEDTELKKQKLLNSSETHYSVIIHFALEKLLEIEISCLYEYSFVLLY